MIRLDGPAATEAMGRRLASKLRAGDAVALFGDLGAGKTTLARGILAGLGHQGDVASPTFPIVIPYEELRIPAWHVDLYRIEDPAEIEELALDEGLQDGVVIVEWPERMGRGLWSHSLRLILRREGEGARALTAEVPAAWEGRWPPR
ncbi:MAG TPA: tRNA (adenosine(37)-N6)-threonylcarbamoyltransferase complex ATPase subunit type 1 TsaE [Allosphingosinicella sp.]|jgi:tRNA threonylcarbamoyladenosine biosynthesis protein TsaE|nr:tRNA (adenosine(37)-N6)-threonylcarbamoyltransferase complex ATPase subunit type 1 TsaE [Allosphingosinicella sp.]